MAHPFRIVSQLNPVVISGNITMSGAPAVSLTGNTAGTMALVSSGTVYFAGGDNVTLSQSNNTISIHAGGGPGGGADGYNIIAAGGSTANSTGTVVFSNSNGVSFGLNGNTVTATVRTDYQSAGAYLTTAMASNRGSDFVQATAAFAGTNATGTIASNGISVSVNPQTAYVFSNSNGVSFGTNGSTVTATVATNYQSQGAYLTTAALSDHSHGNPTLALTNLSGTTASNSNGLTLSLSAAAGGGGADGYNIIAAGGSTANSTGTIVFSNSNGVSFGLNGATVTATVETNYQSAGAYLTTARASNDAIGLNTALTANGVAWTVNSSGLSLNVPAFLTTGALSNHSHGNPTLNLTNLSGTTASNSAGFTLSLSAAAPGGGADVVASASNGSFSFTTLGFSNANNVTFGTSAGGIITASVAAPGAAAENNWFNLTGNTAGNTTASGSTVMLSAGNNITLSGTNGSVIRIDGLQFFAGTQVNNGNSISFGDSNGISFGMNEGSLITGSVPAVSSLVGSSGISISTNGSTITIGRVLQSTYVPLFPGSTASQTVAALGATSASARFFPISLSDNIIFNELRVMHNLSYQTSSVSGQQTISYSYGLFSNNAGSLSSISSGSFSLAVTNSSVSHTVSYPVSTGTAGYTYTTLTQSTTANIQSFWGTAAGGRPIGFHFGDTMSLSSGVYWLGVLLRHSSSSANIGVSIGIGGNANAMWNNVAGIGQASSAQTTNSFLRQPYIGLGAYTVSQSTMPNAVPITQIAHTQTIMPLVTFIST